MSKHQALRDLQNRLAERLQTARQQSAAQAWLAVEAGQGRYLLPLHQSGEIFSPPSLLRVPYTSRWFIGVANLRGVLYGVVDLADFLGVSLAHGEGVSGGSRVISLNPELAGNVALKVDALVGLRRPDAFVQVLPAAAGLAAHLGSQYQDVQGQLWRALDLQALAQWADFLNIGT
ncbi:MAG: chemotaxis protein CheW [Rhodoferax sp.]|uniref:chemotaxis protein CheW n=1 Tax=Rhodoferax sp. TaxID=50421 RepID=UPI001B47FAD1|nr:chemotaxis protein CheW [Rhodoferax sp.]MBP9906153.1 chemotaxis protein CheW [Rhodoferax sp.]